MTSHHFREERSNGTTDGNFLSRSVSSAETLPGGTSSSYFSLGPSERGIGYIFETFTVGGGGEGEWGEVVLLQHHTMFSCYIWLIVVKVQESPIIVFRTRSKA